MPCGADARPASLFWYKINKDYASTTREGGGLDCDRARAGGDTLSRKRFLRRSVIVALSTIEGRLSRRNTARVE